MLGVEARARPSFRDAIKEISHPNQVIHDWDWAAAALWRETADSHCQVSMVDTVVFRDEKGTAIPDRWLFTSKNGTITRKKDENVSIQNIRERFIKISSGNQKNTQEYVAWLYLRNGSRRLLNRSEFYECLSKVEVGNFKNLACLQCFIFPKDGEASTIRSHFELNSKKRYRIETMNKEERDDISTRLKKEIDGLTKRLIQYFDKYSHVRTTKLTAEYVIDENNNIWLLYIPQLVTQILENSQSLPHLHNLKKRSGVQRSEASGLPLEKCPGDFCTTKLVDLPGLCREITEESDSNNTKPPTRDRLLKDSGQRHPLPYMNVLLADLEMDFLKGQVEGDNILQKWKEMDKKSREKYGISKPDQFYKSVSVCTNCYSIYQKLKRFRDAGFTNNPAPAKQQKLKKKQVVRQIIREEEVDVDEASTPETNHEVVREVSWEVSSEDKILKKGKKKKRLKSQKKAAKQQQQQQQQNDDEAETATTIDIASAATRRPGSSMIWSRGEIKPPTAVDTKKLEQLECENKILREKCGTMEKIAHDVETKLTETTKNLANTKRDFANAMKEKDSYLKRKMLKIEQQHVQELANASRRQSNGSTGEETQPYLDTIEQLNREMDRIHLERENEKQKLLYEHQRNIEKLSHRLKEDLEGPRAKIAQQEDQLDLMKREVYEYEKRLSVANNMIQETTAQMKYIEAERDEWKAQASTAAVATPTPTVSDDSKVHQLQFEAKESQYLNQLTYLKAQVQSEMTCKEELGENVAALTATIEKMKKERKTFNVELEQQHKVTIDNLDARYKEEMSQNETQIASYKGRLAQLQTTMTELIQDAALAKKKEEMANMASEKMALENANLLKKNMSLRSNIEELNDTLNGSKNSLEEAQKSNMEATLRRLENDKQYVLSQLTSETKCKQELEKSVKDLQKQVETMRQTFMEESRALEKSNKTKIDTLTEALRQSKERMIHLNSEVSNGERQLDDIRTEYSKLKEKSRVEQQQLETIHSEKMQMKQKLIQAKEETLRERNHAKESSERQSASLAMVKASMESLNSSKDAEIQQLEATISQHLEKIVNTQASLQETQSELDAAQVLKQKSLGVMQLANVFEKKRIRALTRGFDAFVLTLTMTQVLSQEQEKHQGLLQETRKKACEQNQKCVQLLRENFNAELQSELEKQKSELTNVAQLKQQEIIQETETRINQVYEEERSKYQVDTLQVKEQYEKRLEELQLKANEELQTAQTESQLQLTNVKGEYDQLQRQWTQEKEEMAQEHENMLQKAIEFEKQVAKEQLDEATAQYDSNLSNLIKNNAAELQALSEEAALLRETALTEEKERLEQALNECTEQAKQSYETERVSLLESHERELLQLKQSMEEANTACVDNDREHWQRLLEQEKESSLEQLKVLRTTLESEKETELNETRDRMNEIKGNAIMQCTAKWQRALEELTERTEIEKKSCYEKGVHDREQEWQKAACDIKQAQEEEMEKMKNEAQAALKLCEEKFDLLLLQKTKEIKDSMERERNISIASTKQEMGEQLETQLANLNASHAQRLVEMEEKAAEQLKTELARVQEEHEDTLDDMRLAAEKEREKLESEWKEKVTTKAEEIAENEKQLTQRAIEQAIEKGLIDKRTALAELREELSKEHAQNLQHEKEQYERQIDTAVADSLAKKETEHVAHLKEVQHQCKLIVDKSRSEIERTTKENETLGEKVETLSLSLEEAEDTVFDREKEYEAKVKQHAFRVFTIVTGGLQNVASKEKELEKIKGDHEKALTRLEEEKNDEIDDIQSQLDTLKDEKTKNNALHKELRQTLVDYKRDTLLKQKVASNVLVEKLKDLRQQEAAERHDKNELQNEISIMEKAVQELEAQIHDVSKESSVKDGRVNTALAAKKRRLHEEFETLLEAIEQKRRKVSEIDERIAHLGKQRMEKESELKTLERELVAVLVEQQKRVLTLLPEQ